MILRVQNSEGRGPFQPGLTKQWCEYHHDLPAIFQEFSDLTKAVQKYHEEGYHLGVGVRGMKGINNWFTPIELEKLTAIGFYIVEVPDPVVICESKNQLVFATMTPLSELKQPHKDTEQ